MAGVKWQFATIRKSLTWGFVTAKPPFREFGTSHLEDLAAHVRSGDESFPFSHDAESLARVSVLNLTCDYGNFDVCAQPAGIAGGYDELAQRAHTVLMSVDGDTFAVRCADPSDIVRSKQAANRPKDREAMELLVAQLEHRDATRRPRRGPSRGLSL